MLTYFLGLWIWPTKSFTPFQCPRQQMSLQFSVPQPTTVNESALHWAGMRLPPTLMNTCCGHRNLVKYACWGPYNLMEFDYHRHTNLVEFGCWVHQNSVEFVVGYTKIACNLVVMDIQMECNFISKDIQMDWYLVVWDIEIKIVIVLGFMTHLTEQLTVLHSSTKGFT